MLEKETGGWGAIMENKSGIEIVLQNEIGKETVVESKT